MHVFLDSSVVLAFCRSKTGGSALVLDWCRQGKVNGYISQKVVYEVHNNNRKDTNETGETRFNAILHQNFLTIVDDVSSEETEKANHAFDNPKDAPIIASAKQIPHLTHILSLDKGFFKPEVIRYVEPIQVMKPGVFIQCFRTKLET